MFSSFFGPAVAGFYAIGQRVLQMPITLISMSVGRVLLPRMAESVQEGRPIRPLIRKSTFGLALVGLIPFGAIFVFGPSIFAFVFGAEWNEAGLYARWLIPSLYFWFINIPSVKSLPFSQSQRFLLFWEIITTIIKIAIIGAGGLLFKNVLLTIKIYSVFGAGMYILLIVEGYRRADVGNRIRNL
jgi:O-antigen/teichoic acid export membrane protein